MVAANTTQPRHALPCGAARLGPRWSADVPVVMLSPLVAATGHHDGSPALSGASPGTGDAAEPVEAEGAKMLRRDDAPAASRSPETRTTFDVQLRRQPDASLWSRFPAASVHTTEPVTA